MIYLKYYEELDTHSNIHSICQKYGIGHYTINNDGSIDVDDGISLSDMSLTTMPLKFRNVKGSFYCQFNKLTSLEGCPSHVGGSFYCQGNKLVSLKFCPVHVGGNFMCGHNKLTTLEGCPVNINHEFDCSSNELVSLEGCPSFVGDVFDCCYNKLASLEGNPINVLGDFHCSFNELLTSLDNSINVSGDFKCIFTPFNSLWELFGDKDKIELFNDYDIVRDNGIILDRLNSFLKDIGKDPVEKVDGYVNI